MKEIQTTKIISINNQRFKREFDHTTNTFVWYIAGGSRKTTWERQSHEDGSTLEEIYLESLKDKDSSSTYMDWLEEVNKIWNEEYKKKLGHIPYAPTNTCKEWWNDGFSPLQFCRFLEIRKENRL